MANLRSKVNEHLSCAICLEQFKNPKVLPCLHSYCYDCIMTLEKTEDYNITCPECRIQLQVGDPPDISFLPSNFFVNNLLATLSLTSDSEVGNIVCDNCDSGEHAQARCQQCNRYLCEFCITSHKRSRDTKQHNIITLDELKESGASVIAETTYCPKHKGEIALYCTTCQKTICRDCTIVDHREHNCSFVGDVIEERMAGLEQLVGEVKTKRTKVNAAIEEIMKTEENLEARTGETVREINQYFGNIFKALEMRRNQLIKETNSLKCSKLKQLHAQREELEMTLASIESNLQFTEQAFENGSNVQILNMEKYILESLESLKNKENESEPCVNDYIEFISGTTAEEVVDEGLSLCSVQDEKKDQKLYDHCDVYFEGTEEYLQIGVEAQITIFSGYLISKQGKTNIKLLFKGVKVQDVTLSNEGHGSYIVSFVPLEAGVLLFNVCINGRCPTRGFLTKNVKWGWKNDTPENVYIGDCIFDIGVHTWMILVKKCGKCVVCKFDAGVIGVEGNIDATTGHYWANVSRAKLDMSKKQIVIFEPLRDILIHPIQSAAVQPYFKHYCNQCTVELISAGPNKLSPTNTFLFIT